MIQLRDVYYAYLTEPVLKGINLDIPQGTITVLSGENGSGKSTLLKVILGELIPQQGEVRLMDTPVAEMTDFSAVSYVPQVQVMNQVAFKITCLELVSLNLYREFGFWKIPTQAAKAKARKQMEALGLSEYVDTPFNELSGGLKQRTMIARALVNEPKLLILDEPTANVDAESTKAFLAQLNQLKAEEHLTIVIVSHDLQALQENLAIDTHYRLRLGELSHA